MHTQTDTAGQERFRTLTSSYYRNADAIIVVYDITDKESFQDVKGHITEGTRYSQRSEKFIVGNKNDLGDDRQVDKDAGNELASSLSVAGFFETSAKTGDNVDEFFECVARQLMEG
jgi:Ras-related protein Rab-1A